MTKCVNMDVSGGRCSEENEAPDSVARADCVCVVRLILHLCYWGTFCGERRDLSITCFAPYERL